MSEHEDRVGVESSAGNIDVCDRTQLSAFLQAHYPQICGRIRRKLGRHERQLFDSQDIFSTMTRRIDALAARGELRARSEAELIALITTVVDRALIDCFRVSQRLRQLQEPGSGWATLLADRLESDSLSGAADPARLSEAFSLLADPADRAILTLWLQGTPHTGTALALGMKPTTVRDRWQRIRQQLESWAENAA